MERPAKYSCIAIASLLFVFIVWIVVMVSQTNLDLLFNPTDKNDVVYSSGLSLEERLAELQNVLPEDEFLIFKDFYELQSKTNSWKHENSTEAKKIEDEYWRLQNKIRDMKRNNPDQFKREYPNYSKLTPTFRKRNSE